MKPNALSMHSSVAGRANLATYLHAAKAAGFDCVDPPRPSSVISLKEATPPET